MASGNREGAEDVRAQWEQTFSGASRGISVTDPVSGIMHSVNPAFAAMHGGTRRPARGEPADPGVPAAGAGDLAYRIAWFEDLSDRRAAEAEDRDLDATFETAFTSAPSGVALIGLDGRFLRVNPALCELLGRAEDELVGSTSKHFTHPDDRALTARAFTDLNTTTTVVAVRKRYLRPSGEVVWAATHGTTVHDDAGRPRFIVSHFQDITARTLAEQRQAEATALVESAFMSAPIGMALVGLDGALAQGQRRAVRAERLRRGADPGAQVPGDDASRRSRRRARAGSGACWPARSTATRQSSASSTPRAGSSGSTGRAR
jgi:PAS domain S-box-containing protein